MFHRDDDELFFIYVQFSTYMYIFALQVEKIYNSSGKIPTYIKEIATMAKRERHTDSLMKIEGAEVS